MSSAATASPKVSKSKLPIIQPPTFYGCEHIGFMFQEDRGTSRNSYSSATRVALDPDRLTVQKCARCSYMLTQTYLCMQCPMVHCLRDAKQHAKEQCHTFGVDSRSGHVFCFQCEDYIYDPVLEEIRIEQEASIDGGVRKRRRLEDSKPSTDELKYIESHTTFAPCRATGLRGFLNMGSTCFMNVILQSLIHNPLVRNFYLSDGHKQKECTRTNCMSCAMDEVFIEFFTQDKLEGFGPVNLLTTSWKCEQTLAGYQQQDAHEYLQFLLNQLHYTNKGTEQKSEDCSCIIHRSFYGKLQSDVTCEGCKNVTTALDPVMDLSLDLRIKDKKKLVVPGSQGIVQTVQQCLARFTATEKLGVNEYNCGKCSGPKEATKQLTIKRLPPVLCIQLKRFEHSANGSSKIDVAIRFPLELDMTPFTTRAKRKAKEGEKESKPVKPYIYDLLSVVVHKGEINTGHYSSYCRENGQWFQFDDSMVTLATEKQVLAAQAYLLVYIIRTLS
ncbi:cysteine proteinase [Wilcoxina mikolae CBS 423.85]|nr:cysteine proteinase [Wilcoxina mikolae CBS 423.85]